ncbi:hypothetical protein C8Q74DRAFT_926622 [Fomes fomentarius]|nr:hypothetical protein C8Q74DRAFT_926622 [Fomes fomentarius]
MEIPEFPPMSGTASTAHFRSRKATEVAHQERRPFEDVFPKWRDTAVDSLRGSRSTNAEGSIPASEAAAAEPVEQGRQAPSGGSASHTFEKVLQAPNGASAPYTYEKVFSPPRKKDSIGELDALFKGVRPQVPIPSAPTPSSIVSEEKREQARHRLANLSYVEGENILEILLDVSKMHKYLKLMHDNMEDYADELVERGQELLKEGRELVKRGEMLKGYVQSSMKYLSASDAGVEALDKFFCDNVPGEDIPEGALMEHGNISYQSSDDFTRRYVSLLFVMHSNAHRVVTHSTAMDTEDVKGKRKASFEDYDDTHSFSPMKRSRIESDRPSEDEVE